MRRSAMVRYFPPRSYSASNAATALRAGRPKADGRVREVMTKAEIAQAIYTRVGGFSKNESAGIVGIVFDILKETLVKGEKVKISGFGKFILRDKRQRPGRNPQTGRPIKITERRVLTFKASQILKRALNPRHRRHET